VQRSLGFSSIDIRVSGRNLKTWTNYTGYDPETNLGGTISSGAGAGGVDYFNNRRHARSCSRSLSTTNPEEIDNMRRNTQCRTRVSGAAPRDGGV